MGIVFQVLQEPELPKHLVTWIANTPFGKTIGWLWARFWSWGTLSWIILGILIPVGIGVAEQGMYLAGRCFVLTGVVLGIIKVIDDAVVEKKPRREMAWISMITVAVGAAITYGCFSAIDTFEWNHEMVIRMTFKQSSLFTERHKRHIQWDMNTYFLYLTKVGLDLPTELPPLGVTPPGSISVVGGSVGGPISTHMMEIAEDAVFDADSLRAVYSAYVFNRILVAPDMLRTGLSRTETENDEKAAWIFECYFPASYAGHKICTTKETPGYQWQEALWEIRETFGRDYADGLMSYTVTLWKSIPPKDVEKFDKFFRYKLASGEAVKGDVDIDSIFKRHGLNISPPW